MSGLAALDLLDLWERGLHRAAPERALDLLATALPERDPEELADFDLGLRDRHLLDLRSSLFGPKFVAHGECPHCSDAIEVELDARDLLTRYPLADLPRPAAINGRHYRLPNSHDLISIACMNDIESATQALFHACCLDAGRPDPGDFARVEEALSALSEERRIVLELHCELCGERWRSDFDPGAFCWEEISAAAHALLDDVHILASTYGWSETEILALGPERRRAYLERAQP